MAKTIDLKDNRAINAIGVIITIIICLVYLLAVNKQHGYLKRGTERLQVLALRGGSAFPIYALCMMISLLQPDSFAGLQIGVAFMEGYAFYTFFGFVTHNLGGPSAAVKKITQNHKDGNGWFCSSCCCPADITNFYNRAVRSEWHFVVTRTIIIIIATIFDYASENPDNSEKKKLILKALFGIFSLIGFIILCNGILTLVNYYENVMKDCVNLKAIMKMFLVKSSTGLMVIQGLLVQFACLAKKCTVKSSGAGFSQFNTDDTALRIFSILLLIEYIVLTVLFWLAFSPEMDPPPTLPEPEAKKALEKVDISLCAFLCNIFRFSDGFNDFNLDESLSSQSQLTNGANSV